MQTEGYADFDDFVRRHHYRYGANLADVVPQRELDAHTELDSDRIRILSIAKHVDDLDDDSVAVNRTTDSAVVVQAEPDADDPCAGKIHYAVFLPDRAETYLFTESVKIGPDGVPESTVTVARKWEMGDNDERNAFERLAKKFGGGAEVEKPSAFRDFAQSAGVPIGGEASAEGAYAVEKTPDRVAVSSGAEVNATTGIQLGSSYARSGPSLLSLKIFRENAQGIITAAAQAAVEGPQDDAQYETYSRMQTGISVFKP